jgi:hypothetical protein
MSKSWSTPTDPPIDGPVTSVVLPFRDVTEIDVKFSLEVVHESLIVFCVCDPSPHKENPDALEVVCVCVLLEVNDCECADPSDVLSV